MINAKLSLMLAERMAERLPADERKKLAIARETLRELQKIDPGVVMMAIALQSLENAAAIPDYPFPGFPG